MIIGKTVFPGTCTLNQLELIVGLTGKPTEEDIGNFYNLYFFLEAFETPLATGLLENLDIKKQKSFKSFFINASSDELDIIHTLLQFNPKIKLTVEDSIAHPFFKDVRCIEDEISYDKKIDF